MKVIHQLAPLEFNTALKHQTAQVQSNSAVLPAGHLFGWAASSIKRLLVVGFLALSLSAFASDPTATDMGRFIKFTGKQAVTSPVEEDDVACIRKSAIIRFESTKQLVTITLTSGYVAYAFETKAAATAFLAQIAALCVKEE